jgi:RNA polymerase sigma factor (sigma-70 family)
MDAESLPGAARADRDLLRAFVDRADGDAFAELVARHGPLVLGVCRRRLANIPEAEDAFQATFLILARKAASVAAPDRLGSWLYGVALRCSSQARKAARRVKKQPIPDLPAREPPDAEWSDVGPVLDAEIGRLPKKFRDAIVLCELQELDRATAAERLGVPVGTVSSRLSRAKQMLRARLVRRGIALSLAALALILTQAAQAAVPAALVRQTADSATRFAAGKGAGTAATLAGRVLRAPARKAVLIGLFAVTAVLVLGVVIWALFGRAVDDRVAIQGTWRVASSRYAGQEVPGMFGPTTTIDGARFRFIWGDAPYLLDPTQSPKVIDFYLPFGPNGQTIVLLGVYELTGDRLRIHLAEAGRPRPASVEPADGSEQMVILLERIPD